MKEVVWVAQLDTLRGLLSRQDPKQFLFFTRTANGKREGKAFLARLQERTIDRDTPTSLSSYFAQLKACRRWGKEEPHDLSFIRHPVFLANGDNDRMLPTPNTLDMARRIPNNELVIYPDAGHGGIFQFPRAVRREGSRVPREVAPRRRWAVPASQVARTTGARYSGNVHGGRWWTLRGHQIPSPTSAKTTETATKQAETRSPLTDSNRRPPLPCFARQPVATHSNGFRLSEPLSRPLHLPPFATGCNHGAP
jgi:hypothetical protein